MLGKLNKTLTSGNCTFEAWKGPQYKENGSSDQVSSLLPLFILKGFWDSFFLLPLFYFLAERAISTTSFAVFSSASIEIRSLVV